jgi:hypothetical protein
MCTSCEASLRNVLWGRRERYYYLQLKSNKRARYLLGMKETAGAQILTSKCCCLLIHNMPATGAQHLSVFRDRTEEWLCLQLDIDNQRLSP